jgi:hypothetical protein
MLSEPLSNTLQFTMRQAWRSEACSRSIDDSFRIQGHVSQPAAGHVTSFLLFAEQFSSNNEMHTS